MTAARKALVVANDEYLDTGLQRLHSPGQDAIALSDVLGDPAIGQFDVTVVRNAKVQELREKLDSFFSTAGRTDELLVHFSCHGLKDDANDLYLAATDTRASMLASTGLPADFVARRMRASRARSIALFLDCCYGGAFERGMLARAGTDVPVLDSFGQDRLAEGAGRVVITASSAVEYAFESGDLTDAGQAVPSVFTSAIVQGISTGEADSDGTGMISVRELFAYAERHVRRVNPHQTPHLWSFGTRGDIMVARSPLRRIVPSPLPVAVQTALAGDRISRLGAVHVLSELLDESDPPTALAAVQALQYLVDDDSRSLSEAATANLHRVRLTAVPAAIEVTAGTPTSAQVVLGGSVLAIAARVESSPVWIQAKQVGDHLTLTITPTEAGEGTIRVAGPTGSIDLRVTATAPAPTPERAPTPEPPPAEAPPPKSPAAQAGPTSPAPSTFPDQLPQPEETQAQQKPRPAAPAKQSLRPTVPKPAAQPSPTPPASQREPQPPAGLASPFGTADRPDRQDQEPLLFRLWIAAAVCQFLTLFLPLNDENFRFIGGTGGGEGIWIFLLLITVVLLAVSGALTRRPPTIGTLVTGVIATGVSALFAVAAVAVGAAEGTAVGNVVAVIAALIAVIALIQTIRKRLRRQPSTPKGR